MCKPPTRFQYTSSEPGFEKIPTTIPGPTSQFGSPMLLDVDGDGLDDLVSPDTDPAPAWPMKQISVCATSAVLADSQFGSIPASAAFGVDQLHNFARGDGQVVAVIDSGVQPVSRLPRLISSGRNVVD